MWADDFDILVAPDQRLMDSSRPLCPSCQYNFDQNTSQQRKYRIGWPDSQVLQDAQKYMSHAKRKKLTREDLDLALRVEGQEPLYGTMASEHLPFRFASGT